MADKIKKFFAKKKVDAKFKLAGPGHRLDSSSSSSVNIPSDYKTPSKQEPSEARRQAAEAALLRVQSQQRKQNPAFNTSLAAIQAQVKKELDAENKQKQPSVASKPTESEPIASSHLAVKGVYFRCPIINDEILTKEEWRGKIKEFLFNQLEEERGLTACLIINSCNYNKTKVKEGIEILSKYLDNIINNPEEVKYHKIRCSNNTFKEKVTPLLGATELLHAAGFQIKELEHNGNKEDFWVFEKENVEGIETLEFLKDALNSEDRIELELDRNLQVLSPAQAARRVELPPDFYALTADELKREMQLRTEAMEKQMQLRTKAMREKDESKEIRKYKFTLIRVRFPDGLYLQGTFSVYEKFEEAVNFVKENLENSDAPFILTSPTGQKFEESDYSSTFFQLKLVPAVILTFQWDPLIANQMAKISNTFLKPEIMMLMQSM
ncbi:UBX domain-containing protein 6 isoform X2 [Agrilus planipennis]|uniref:UBX domain-containing protein 6 isoform X2 n=1 Tax=Agrilus planipennis TaxID=224129 RepID=A0A7F5RMB7_AGRPL|nr:UBX domain-containing protein 6 isoform X2 [Agrilus planipennis]